MNIPRPLTTALTRAALSPRAAKTELSVNEMHEIAGFAARAHDALAHIREASEKAIAEGVSIAPESVIAFLADNNLILTELSNG